MKKIFSLIFIFMLFKFLIKAKPMAIPPIIGILFVLFLIRTMFRSAFGKTKSGRSGSIYDDYL